MKTVDNDTKKENASKKIPIVTAAATITIAVLAVICVVLFNGRSEESMSDELLVSTNTIEAESTLTPPLTYCNA